MIPDDLQSAAASSLERSESVAPTYVANGVLEGESPRDRANTDESLTIRGRSDSETVAAKLKIEIVEPDETSVSTDVEDSPRSVDSEDAADMIAGAVRPRKNTLTIDDAYDRASDNDDEEDSEEESEKHSESEEVSSESVVSAPAENAEGSTSGQPEGAEETHAEETADEQPSSDEARSGPEEEHAQEGENLKETAPESPEKSSSIASSGTDTSMGSVPDTWSPDIPRNDPKKLMRLQSDSF